MGDGEGGADVNDCGQAHHRIMVGKSVAHENSNHKLKQCKVVKLTKCGISFWSKISDVLTSQLQAEKGDP